MKNINSLLVLLFMFTTTLMAQPEIEWARNYGGSEDEAGIFIEKTEDGGYFIAGRSKSNDTDVLSNKGSFDIWAFRLNAQYDTIWTTVYGGSSDENIMSMVVTQDNDLLISGITSSTDGDIREMKGIYDAFLLKINGASGDTLWSKTLGGSSQDLLYADTTSDGNFMLVGRAFSDDGDIVGDLGSGDGWVIKMDQNGDTLWTKLIGGNGPDRVENMKSMANGGLLGIGSSRSSNGDLSKNYGVADAWLFKLNDDGDIVWSYSYGGSSWEAAYDAVEDKDGNIIFVGDSQSDDFDIKSNAGFYDAWIVKFDPASGDTLWTTLIGTQELDRGLNIFLDYDSSYAYVEYYSDTVYSNLAKVDIISGDTLWTKSYFGNNGMFNINDILFDPEGDMLAVGSSENTDNNFLNNYGKSDLLIMNLSNNVTGLFSSVDQNIHLYPNPFNDYLTLQLEDLSNVQVTIKNQLGKVVKNYFLSGVISPMLDLSDLSQGLYVLTLTIDNEKTISSKILKK